MPHKERPTVSSRRVMRAYRLNTFEDQRLQKSLSQIDRQQTYHDRLKISSGKANHAEECGIRAMSATPRDGWLGVKSKFNLHDMNFPKPCTRELRRALTHGRTRSLVNEMNSLEPKEQIATDKTEDMRERTAAPLIKGQISMGITKNEGNKLVEKSGTLMKIAYEEKVRSTIGEAIEKGEALPDYIMAEKLMAAKAQRIQMTSRNVKFDDVTHYHLVNPEVGKHPTINSLRKNRSAPDLLQSPRSLTRAASAMSVLRRETKSSRGSRPQSSAGNLNLDTHKLQHIKTIVDLDKKVEAFAEKHPLKRNSNVLPRISKLLPSFESSV
ncbi:uncharacterized protein LOC106169800 [Lingula anatina]|uniref:Uncharacterized protein LOC106169800 n=1 Tax=Lingula anatina TaxID=7574 RepID=A0A1S3J3N1_LINAN|nr:uncharacterized protein LOC106169800 [Lingula anatina]XP_013404869.1 uncharacterized protein LOC106169800 [Lingula anatina]XP_013404870.1 uncharacterized protein LOC106169800 [Lingula anatina]|eukprot:XP_013404868.1 uncharacterized protein LOC106169800 [Lingula anatina]